LFPANALNTAAKAKNVDERAEAFEHELWLSSLAPAVKRLRRALEAYVRAAPHSDVEQLRREVVAAEVLSSF
jgi:hypothetical protein